MQDLLSAYTNEEVPVRPLLSCVDATVKTEDRCAGYDLSVVVELQLYPGHRVEFVLGALDAATLAEQLLAASQKAQGY
jgi:hypothetical protein